MHRCESRSFRICGECERERGDLYEVKNTKESVFVKYLVRDLKYLFGDLRVVPMIFL